MDEHFPSDDDLFEILVGNDESRAEAALEQLRARHDHKVRYRLGKNHLIPLDDREDVSQDVWLYVWTSRKKKAGRDFLRWLGKVVKYKARDYFKLRGYHLAPPPGRQAKKRAERQAIAERLAWEEAIASDKTAAVAVYKQEEERFAQILANEQSPVIRKMLKDGFDAAQLSRRTRWGITDLVGQDSGSGGNLAS